MQLLGGLSREDFLRQYWQKKPLLVRQALPDYTSPISAEEFGGLACEDDVESRLVQEKGGEQPWQVRHGPFSEKDFLSLPESHWTLLVQSVDHHIPALAVLLDEFNFIPAWRVDDLMVSFAQRDGSVGPHFDNYDVFLLQVEGKRHWHINENICTDNDLLPGSELKILKDFYSDQDWVLEPGDMLYLPPGVAHHGIAINDCLTFSIGFRAPTRRELLMAYTESSQDDIADAFYTDEGLTLQESAGEINKTDIYTIKKLMRLSNVDEDEFNSWFGCFITEKTNELIYENGVIDEKEFHSRFKQFERLTRNGNVRVSYIRNDESLSLYVAGEEFVLSETYLQLIQYLTTNHVIDYKKTMQYCEESAAIDLLYKLYDSNNFFFDE